MTFSSCRLVVLTIIGLFFGSSVNAKSADEADRLQNLSSWSETSALAKRLNAPIILLIEQRHCAFCQRLKREVFKPLANDPSYFDSVIFASVLIDFDGPAIEKEGNEISGFEFAESFNASTTPTVLFLDHSSNEIQTRIIGYTGGDSYYRHFIGKLESSVQATSSEN